jgi:hypothetical protein
MSDIDSDIYNDVVEVAHPFEVEINVLVKLNHQLTLEGIAKQEEDEIAETEESLELEDRDLVDSQIRWQQNFYAELRKAANHLAVVGLVTRFQHWIENFVKQSRASPSRAHKCKLRNQLEALNKSLGVGPVRVAFFEDLVNARDSVIHGDSKAKWEFNGTREVAAHYRSGSGLEITEVQLSEAIEKRDRAGEMVRPGTQPSRAQSPHP